MATRPWSHIDQMISCANGVFIMLDDENGVTDGGQPAKRRDQTVVVALMQSNRRLV